MMSKRDAHVNMVRTCIAVAAAGLGGADAITALPFTMAVGLPDRFARRVARNTQLILIEEAHLAKVMDPAAGAGAIENFTDQLCHIAWAVFQGIEQVGGAWATLERGDLQSKIAEVRAQGQADVATRKTPLTGASDFPNLAEAPISVLMSAPVPAEPARQRVQFEPLPPLRLAQSFEELRERSDAMLTRNGARPNVFLAHLGSPSEFSARANFAKSFFEAGGIETATHEAGRAAPADDTTLALGFAQSGAKLACLCSSDALYASQGAAAINGLKNAGALVWVAGKPMRELEASGASGFVYAGCDVLAALRKAYALIEQRETG
jgi:methylmalonyl-CoA mutase